MSTHLPKRQATYWMLLFFSFGLTESGCFKTRAQLRRENSDLADTEVGLVKPAQPLHVVTPQSADVIDELKVAVTQLEGRIEVLEHTDDTSSPNSKQAQEILRKLGERLGQLEQSQANLTEQWKKMNENQASRVIPQDTGNLLERAKAHFKNDQFEQAIQLANQFLKKAKPNEASEAIFLKAEAFWKLKQYKKAIVDYSKFPELYPRSSRLPESLYKIGLSFEALGLKEDAKGFYQDLIDKFPKSAQAKKARKKI